jgi:hypothetical protein
MKIFPIVVFVWFCCVADITYAGLYGIAHSATPVLNSPYFSSVFGGITKKILKADRCGQVRELEFIALPETVFTIRATLSDGQNKIFQVDTDEYPTPADSRLFVDSRFLDTRPTKPQQRLRTLPAKNEIIAALKGSIGAPYVWGGNIQGGVAELLGMFYSEDISATNIHKLTLSGMDCSGLLYQATGGWTPRNTSRLVSFGDAVPVAGKSLQEIEELLKPLDLIVWNGHVVIVLDSTTVIESRLECGKRANGGVMVTPLRQRLAEIVRTRQPQDSWPVTGKQRGVFVVRRWYSFQEKH